MIDIPQNEKIRILEMIYETCDYNFLLPHEQNLIVCYEKVLSDIKEFLKDQMFCANYVDVVSKDQHYSKLEELKQSVIDKDDEISRLVDKIRDIRLEQCDLLNVKLKDHVEKRKSFRSVPNKNPEIVQETVLITEENQDPVNDSFFVQVKEQDLRKSSSNRKKKKGIFNFFKNN